jgi:hypothetical protein
LFGCRSRIGPLSCPDFADLTVIAFLNAGKHCRPIQRSVTLDRLCWTASGSIGERWPQGCAFTARPVQAV